jgi:hypothetical protein
VRVTTDFDSVTRGREGCVECDGATRGSCDGMTRGSCDGMTRGSCDGMTRGSCDGMTRGSCDGMTRGSEGVRRVAHPTAEALKRAQMDIEAVVKAKGEGQG